MSSVTISEVHVIFSGFKQKTATINGTVRVEDRILKIVQNRPNVRVILLPQNADVVDVAERIAKTQDDSGRETIVNVYGYSWGGQTAADFARELQRRSIKVQWMVLTDPVLRASRFLFFFWLFQWRAFVSWLPIRIPRNVKHVVWFRQRNNYPRGHDLVADDPIETDRAEAVILEADHCWMDYSWQWIQACEDAARAVGSVE